MARLSEAELFAAHRNSRRVARGTPEDDLLTAVLDAARALGWLAYHVRRSDRALQQGDPGFPDVILARGGRVLALELKAQGGRVAAEQWVWIHALDGATVDARVIYPSDLDELLRRWLR
jgi:VRR-NUC domain-containing protein